jgi:very-short-patch-repair endonuclease
MTVLVIVVVVLLAIVAMAFLMRGKTRTTGDRDKIWRRRLLSKNEQPMYFRLRETFPDHVVLAQVAFSSLLNSRSKSTQSTFDRKVADFVLCTPAFEVLAVVELDDANHKTANGETDAASDAMLVEAGYQVLRFERVPDARELKAAVGALPVPRPSHASAD